MDVRNDLPKSLFLSALIAITIFLLAWTSLRLTRDGDLAYIGLLVQAFAILTAIGFLFLFRRARTSRFLWPYTLLIIGGFLWISFAAISSVDLALISASILLLAGWMIYLFWYSIFSHRDDTELAVLSVFPNVNLERLDGTQITTDSFHGQPTIFLFYRGNWCPLCVAQVKELTKQYNEIAQLGAKVVLISPQPPKYTRRLAKRFKVDFTYLVDRGGAAAKKLGIWSKNGLPMGLQVFGYDSDTVLPTVVITDSEGVILFNHQTDNYRIRPEPDVFLSVLKQHIK